MVDIQHEAVKYASRHPYSFTRIGLPNSQKAIRFRFHITEQPDPMVAVMIGDFVHNLRSALDYVVVACVPKKRRNSASFPILFQDIFAKDNSGQFVVNDDDLRKNFKTATEGLHPKARALIIQHQPYNLGVDPGIITLGIISRLENADKHRQLLTIGCGGQDFAASLTCRGLDEPVRKRELLATGAQFLRDNTEFPFNIDLEGIPYPDGSYVQYDDVNMEFTGTAKIFVKVARIGGNKPSTDFSLDTLMDSMMFEVKGILKKLEFFVHST